MKFSKLKKKSDKLQDFRIPQFFKYDQSPILEETDRALERELQTGSSFYLRPKSFFDFHPGGRNGGGRLLVGPDADHGERRALNRPEGPNQRQNDAKRPESTLKEIKEMERELPYFNNRSSFLRHKLSQNKTNKGGSKSKPARTKSSNKNQNSFDGDETGSASSNERSQRNSRRNSVTNNVSMAHTKANIFFEDDHDSGIALNSNQPQPGNPSNLRSRFLEKKSIFTIAYDEVATTKIPSATDNLPT